MFYPVDSLRRGGRFYLCWVADSWPLRFATITHRQLLSQDIRIICDDLLVVINNESGRPTQRFSLRLSSQLLRGLVRIYQRKVNVFLGELCSIHANVFKSANKKWHIQRVEIVRRVARPLPQVHLQETIPPQENEQQIVEMIQASRNAVANIQDITLREPTENISEMLLRPNDGFGEEHPEQALQPLADRTLELVLARADVTARSGLELALDATDRSHDVTRPAAHTARMEGIADHDLTLFTKSTVQDLVPEFEKDIPEIPEIPPVPVLEKSTDQRVPEEPMAVVEAAKEPEQLEIELLELEAPQAKRRRLKDRLIIDKTIKISTQNFRARIGNPQVELRCKDSSDDIISIHVPPEVYFRRPCHGGERITTNVGFVISQLFGRNLGVASVQPCEEREMERPHKLSTRSRLGNIDEEQEVPMVVVDPPPGLPPQSFAEVSELNMCEAPRSRAAPDVTDALTQKVETLSQQRKRLMQEQDAPVASPKRQRSVGYVSFRESHLAKLSSQETALDADKENRSANIGVPAPATGAAEKLVCSMLRAAGLADSPPPAPVAEAEAQVVERGALSDGSETPLGSLDRTGVSLGDSERTTDSKRFIRDQWGTEGTMLKILTLVNSGVKPITVRSLTSHGPTMAHHSRIIAARCFTSILKLKQHGFILITKDPDTLEINDITLAPKVLRSSQEQ